MECYNGSIQLFSDWMRERNLPDFADFINELRITPSAFKTFVDATDDQKALIALFKDVGVKNIIKFKQLFSLFQPWHLSLNPLPISDSKMDEQDAFEQFGSMSQKDLMTMFTAMGMEEQTDLVRKEQYTGKDLTAEGTDFDDVVEALEIQKDDLYIGIKMAQINHFLLELAWLKKIAKKIESKPRMNCWYQATPGAKKVKLFISTTETFYTTNANGEYCGVPNYGLLKKQEPGDTGKVTSYERVALWQIFLSKDGESRF